MMNLEHKLKTMYAVGAACLTLASGCGKQEEVMDVADIANAVEKGQSYESVKAQKSSDVVKGEYDLSTPEKAVKHFFKYLKEDNFEVAGRAVFEYLGAETLKESEEEFKKQAKNKFLIKKIGEVRYEDVIEEDGGRDIELQNAYVKFDIDLIIDDKNIIEEGELKLTRIKNQSDIEFLRKGMPESPSLKYSTTKDWLLVF